MARELLDASRGSKFVGGLKETSARDPPYPVASSFSVIKRTFDIVVSFSELAVLSPLLVLVAIVIKLDSPGPVFFRQERVGRGFRPFLIYKFRTMVEDAPKLGSPITYGNDPRITRVGRVLRKTKLDELP